MPSGRARYPQPIDPERQPAHNRSESIRFARLEKIRTQIGCPAKIVIAIESCKYVLSP